MLISLKQAGLISTDTGVEENTISKPDEKNRIKKEGDTKQVIDANINQE